MDWIVALLIGWLFTNKRRYYTKEELDEIKRQVAQRDGPLLEDQRKPYKWWKFYWF